MRHNFNLISVKVLKGSSVIRIKLECRKVSPEDQKPLVLEPDKPDTEGQVRKVNLHQPRADIFC